MAGRRLLLLLTVLVAIGLPAGALRAACAGRSCDAGTGEAGRVPFCPLPRAVRTAIEQGYYEGRSPDVLAVTAPGSTLEGPQAVTSGSIAWPYATASTSRVPLVFAGAGVDPRADIADGTTLDRVAPTVAEIIDLRRKHPNVRSGTAIEDIADGAVPDLVVMVAWAGVGSGALDTHPHAWPWLRRLGGDAPSTFAADPGSVPLDPAAVLTTIGTGGLPFQHGITGSVVRNDEGEAIRPFTSAAPVPVIASLAEDLDEASRGAAFVGLVAPRPEDSGLVGGRWYLKPGQHSDDVVVRAGGTKAVARSERMVRDLADSRAGRDDVTDVFGIVLEGDVHSLDRWTSRIAETADRATEGRALLVVAGTGDAADASAADAAPLIARAAAELPSGDALIEDVVAGGVFLDQQVLAEEGATGQSVVEALLSLENAEGRAVVRDAFQGFAVSFARYC